IFGAITPVGQGSGIRHSLKKPLPFGGDRIGAICRPDHHLAAKVATRDDAEIPERFPRPDAVGYIRRGSAPTRWWGLKPSEGNGADCRRALSDGYNDDDGRE